MNSNFSFAVVIEPIVSCQGIWWMEQRVGSPNQRDLTNQWALKLNCLALNSWVIFRQWLCFWINFISKLQSWMSVRKIFIYRLKIFYHRCPFKMLFLILEFVPLTNFMPASSEWNWNDSIFFDFNLCSWWKKLVLQNTTMTSFVD